MEGVVTNADTRSEELKNQGNEEFKKGNHAGAVVLYSEALGISISANIGILTTILVQNCPRMRVFLPIELLPTSS